VIIDVTVIVKNGTRYKNSAGKNEEKRMVRLPKI
jgi:hypothetical protein